MKHYFIEAMPAAKAHSMKEFPKESVGVVINNQYHPLENVHETPETDFRVDPKVYLDLENDGVQAIIHSHNEFPHASKKDMEAQINTAVPWGIINMKNGNVMDVFFWGDGLPTQDLVGRPFYGGVYDCYSLVRDWYKENFNVPLPNIAREWDFWNNPNGAKHFEDNLTALFKRGEWKLITNVKEIQPGDALLFKLAGSKVWNHCAIYIGDSLIAQHMEKRLSRTEPIFPMMNRINTIVRPLALEKQ
jgi:cell wall-associated NlpC family hydrolase